MRKFVTLYSIMLLTTVASYGQKLIAYYDFKTGSMNDLSTVGTPANCSTVVGTPVFTAAGLVFNKSSRIEAPYNAKLNVQKWTIMTRVKFKSLPSSGTTFRIAQRGTQGTPNYYGIETYHYSGDPNSHFFGMSNYANSPQRNDYPAVMQAIDTNRWYCLTATFDGANVSGYIDGSHIYTIPLAGPAYSYLGSEALSIGGSPADTYLLDGTIDNLRIYDSTMSPGKIASIACTLVTPPAIVNNLYGKEDTPVFGQATPNPSFGWTSIAYYLPKRVGNAFIQFYSIDGRIVKTLEIRDRGYNTVRFSTDDMAPGIYLYRVSADGAIICGRRMQVR